MELEEEIHLAQLFIQLAFGIYIYLLKSYDQNHFFGAY